MKVWVHINGIQEGPFELENMPLDRMGPDTPVWYNGLPDWMPARQAPEVAKLLERYGFSEPCAPKAPEQQQAPEMQAPAQQAPGQQAPAPQAPHGPDPSMNRCGGMPQGQPWQPRPGWAPQQPQQPRPAYNQAPYPQPGNQPWRVPVGPDGMPMPCPPNYLVWSILLTVLCCNPVGIVAIIYGLGVKPKYFSGDYMGARRTSETTEWWLIITIVTGLILSSCAGFII